MNKSIRTDVPDLLYLRARFNILFSEHLLIQ